MRDYPTARQHNDACDGLNGHCETTFGEWHQRAIMRDVLRGRYRPMVHVGNRRFPETHFTDVEWYVGRIDSALEQIAGGWLRPYSRAADLLSCLTQTVA